MKILIYRIRFENVAGTAQAKMDKDFDRKELGKEHAGDAFHKLSDKMKHSLVMVALRIAPNKNKNRRSCSFTETK